MIRLLAAVVVVALTASVARAGLYYSGERYAPLPAAWQGFLLDQRMLRNLAVAARPGFDASPQRQRYEEEARKLATRPARSADESADLGAIYVRLGEATRAVDLLRTATRRHPRHFALAANLGTAWQQLGDLRQAAHSLENAVRLAPDDDRPFEAAHLKLVRARLRSAPGTLDDLFGVRYVGPSGKYQPGQLADAEKTKLPGRAAALVQKLGLWLPADGPLLWQAAELAAAHGDLRAAAAMMDGCVTQFNMADPALRDHRRHLRAAADALPAPTAGGDHARHAGSLTFRSRRPLASRLDLTPLPPISATGVNAVPWDALTETTLGRPFRPSFPRYLHDLDGKQVALNGYLMPVREEDNAGAFLFVEAPVGCWYCEMPDATGIVYVELPRGTTSRLQRGQVRVTGRLRLNASDAEDFLFALRDAHIGGVN